MFLVIHLTYKNLLYPNSILTIFLSVFQVKEEKRKRGIRILLEFYVKFKAISKSTYKRLKNVAKVYPQIKKKLRAFAAKAKGVTGFS